MLGCEITGITLEQAVSPTMFEKVYEAFLDYQLILFRDVDLPPATQVAFARNFGEVQVHVLSQYHGYKEHPEIYMLSNLDKDGNPSGKHPDRGTLYWHTDGSWKGAHRPSHHDVFGDRAGRRRAKPNSPTCIPPTSCCPPRPGRRSRETGTHPEFTMSAIISAS